MKAVGFLCILMVFTVMLPAQMGITWEEIPGLEARDISIGGDGGMNSDVIYAVGKNTVDYRYGGYVYRWNANNSTWVKQSVILAASVSVSPTGVPWVVRIDGKIFEKSGSFWIERSGYMQKMRANDIGAGKNGVVMVISRSDGHIYRWNGFKWVKVCNFAQGADRIDVDCLGNPWVVNSNEFIFQYCNGQWIDMTSPENIWAYDVGAECSGGWDIWITRSDDYQTPEGGPLYYTIAGGGTDWFGPTDPWVGMKTYRIDLNDGILWTVTGSGKVYKGTMW